MNDNDKWKNDPCRNPALPIVTFPSLRIANSAYVLRSCIINTGISKNYKKHLNVNYF